MFIELTRDDIFRLETRRLWLRWPTLADADALQAIAARREVAEMTATWPHPLPDGEAARRIARIRCENATGRALVVAVTLKSNPAAIIGTAGTHGDDSSTVGLGYFLSPGHWGKGLMTEAIAALVEATFQLSGAKAIEAGCWIDNTASKRVLEKCGFTSQGIRACKAPARSGGAQPAEHFVLTRREWDAHNPRRLAA